MGHREKGEIPKLGILNPGVSGFLGSDHPSTHQQHRVYVRFAGERADCFCLLLKGVWDPETAKSHYSPDKGTQVSLGSMMYGQGFSISCLSAKDNHYLNPQVLEFIAVTPTPPPSWPEPRHLPRVLLRQIHVNAGPRSPSQHFFRESTHHLCGH